MFAVIEEAARRLDSLACVPLSSDMRKLRALRRHPDLLGVLRDEWSAQTPDKARHQPSTKTLALCRYLDRNPSSQGIFERLVRPGESASTAGAAMLRGSLRELMDVTRTRLGRSRHEEEQTENTISRKSLFIEQTALQLQLAEQELARQQGLREVELSRSDMYKKKYSADVEVCKSGHQEHMEALLAHKRAAAVQEQARHDTTVAGATADLAKLHAELAEAQARGQGEEAALRRKLARHELELRTAVSAYDSQVQVVDAQLAKVRELRADVKARIAALKAHQALQQACREEAEAEAAEQAVIEQGRRHIRHVRSMWAAHRLATVYRAKVLGPRAAAAQVAKLKEKAKRKK